MGILEWVVDFLVTPIAEPLQNIFQPIFGAIDKQIIINAGSEMVAGFKATVPTRSVPFKTRSPLSPDDAIRQSWEYYDKVETAYLVSANAIVAVEAATLGQVDISPQNYMGTPALYGAIANARLIRQAEYVEGIYPAVQRHYRSMFTPAVPEAYRLALANARGILPDDVFLSGMNENGLDDYWALVYREQNYEFPAFSVLAELYWREVIDDATFTLWMQRTGSPLEVVEAMKSLRELIPPAGDLVTMVVREAFDPAYVTPAPDVFAEYMAKKGYGRAWADRYWTMHWVPMPLTQAYANLHRGYWTKDDFLNLLKIADIHPMWREDIYNVAFQPPSIREMGYGFDVGVYTLEDIVKYRRWGGLSPDDADKSAVAMVAYRTEAEREALRREHTHLYAMGRETKDELEDNLIRLWTPDPAVPLWLERAELEKLRLTKEPAFLEPRDITASEALFAFEHGLRDETWTRLELHSLAWTDERINLAIEKVKRDIEETEAKEEKAATKELNITQLRELYKHNRITREQLVFGLTFLKYGYGDAELLAQQIVDDVNDELAPRKLTITEVNRLYEYSLLGMPINDVITVVDTIIIGEGVNSSTEALLDYYKSLKYTDDDAYRLTLWTVIDLNLPRLKGMYSKGWIDTLGFLSELANLGIPYDKVEEIAMTIIKAEQPARVAAEKDLTKSEIIKGVKAGVLTPNQGAELLQGIGYDENEAWYLLMINAVVARADPEGYWEMRKVVEQQKKALGQPSQEIPDELISLELQQKEAKSKLEKLKAEKASEEEIGEAVVSLANIESRMRKIIAELRIK